MLNISQLIHISHNFQRQTAYVNNIYDSFDLTRTKNRESSTIKRCVNFTYQLYNKNMKFKL